ncbi:hypothetical protein RJ55_02509 [Drechmeria coniospora]|nr:hypothetical protein RJ55_02509 [Drechmeria coniospora]
MKLATTSSYAVTLLVGLVTASPLADSSLAKRGLIPPSEFQKEQSELASCLERFCQPANGVRHSGWATGQVSGINNKADLEQGLKECKRGCIRGIVKNVQKPEEGKSVDAGIDGLMADENAKGYEVGPVQKICWEVGDERCRTDQDTTEDEEDDFP